MRAEPRNVGGGGRMGTGTMFAMRAGIHLANSVNAFKKKAATSNTLR